MLMKRLNNLLKYVYMTPLRKTIFKSPSILSYKSNQALIFPPYSNLTLNSEKKNDEKTEKQQENGINNSSFIAYLIKKK